MKTNERKKVTYTKDMLIKEIADGYCSDLRTIKHIYNSLEECIFRILSSANEDADISIRLFEGITLDSAYIPERTKINNLTGDTINISSKIKPKANITRTYCEKLTGCKK